MARAVSAFPLAFAASAALVFAGSALAQTSPSTGEAPKKSETTISKAKSRAQARMTKMKKTWAEAKHCRQLADQQHVYPQNRLAFYRDCRAKLAAGKTPATGPNLLPGLSISPEALKPNLGGMTATGDGGALIGQKK
jgi:hypothetical protein